jgi:hypothetical protein
MLTSEINRARHWKVACLPTKDITYGPFAAAVQLWQFRDVASGERHLVSFIGGGLGLSITMLRTVKKGLRSIANSKMPGLSHSVGVTSAENFKELPRQFSLADLDGAWGAVFTASIGVMANWSGAWISATDGLSSNLFEREFVHGLSVGVAMPAGAAVVGVWNVVGIDA